MAEDLGEPRADPRLRIVVEAADPQAVDGPELEQPQETGGVDALAGGVREGHPSG